LKDGLTRAIFEINVGIFMADRQFGSQNKKKGWILRVISPSEIVLGEQYYRISNNIAFSFAFAVYSYNACAIW